MKHTLSQFKEELWEASLKATPIRLAVLSALEKINRPTDVASIMDELKDKRVTADPATVFRIVQAFTEKGIVRQIQLNEGKARYELSSIGDHHHLVCQSCGEIEDISDCNIDELEKDIKKKKNFTVTTHSLEFFGICKDCQK